MKRSIIQLRVGDLVQARVHEVLDARELIFSFQGDLLRVLNDTGRHFNVGDHATLRVTQIDPLQFRFHREHKKSDHRPGRFDVSI